MKETKNDSFNTMEDIAKTFLIISCGIGLFGIMCSFLFYNMTKDSSVSKIIWLIRMILCAAYLLWSIPMTIFYFKKIDKGEQPSLVFKICSVIFVNPIPGILMLVDSEEINENL